MKTRRHCSTRPDSTFKSQFEASGHVLVLPSSAAASSCRRAVRLRESGLVVVSAFPFRCAWCAGWRRRSGCNWWPSRSNESSRHAHARPHPAARRASRGCARHRPVPLLPAPSPPSLTLSCLTTSRSGRAPPARAEMMMHLRLVSYIGDAEFLCVHVCKVYVSVFGDERGKKVAVEGLKARTKYVRSQIGKRMKIRFRVHGAWKQGIFDTKLLTCYYLQRVKLSCSGLNSTCTPSSSIFHFVLVNVAPHHSFSRLVFRISVTARFSNNCRNTPS